MKLVILALCAAAVAAGNAVELRRLLSRRRRRLGTCTIDCGLGVPIEMESATMTTSKCAEMTKSVKDDSSGDGDGLGVTCTGACTGECTDPAPGDYSAVCAEGVLELGAEGWAEACKGTETTEVSDMTVAKTCPCECDPASCTADGLAARCETMLADAGEAAFATMCTSTDVDPATKKTVALTCPDECDPSSPVGMIIGIIVGVLVIGGGAFFFMKKKKEGMTSVAPV